MTNANASAFSVLYSNKSIFLKWYSIYKNFATVLVCVIMLQKHINRYILREILSPTLLCLLIFTMVMVLGRAFKLVELVVNKGVALSDIMVLLATLLPTIFSTTLPLAFLIGIMIGLGRMSADSETVALKSAGFGLAQISIPVFTLAIIFVILTGITNIWFKAYGEKITPRI